MTRRFKCISIALVLTVVSMWALIFFTPAPPLLTGIDYSRAVYASQQQLLRITLSKDGKYRLLTPLRDISPKIIQATLLEEDQYYYWHAGINPISLIKASWLTYIHRGRRIGASTITMQLARIRFGINSKNLSGKVLQIFRALQLEIHYSKDEILEAYLNLAPYGNNIEGVGAASLIYFNKPVKDLSLPEALTLVVIPQNPTKRVPDRGLLLQIRNKLYARWIAQHPQDQNQQALMNLPLQVLSVHTAPFYAPHFVNSILADKKITSDHIVTTLNLRYQKTIERITKNYISKKNNFAVSNAAVMLVDTRDMSVKALVGSADFFNKEISGQVDGTQAKRSPGSTLKPFIYALALDQGIIHPGTILKDVPHSFGSYNPENFDNDFMGPIRAKDALILSRNIPAVYLAEQLKKPSLYDFLNAAGISDLKSEQYYGLALVLGGAEVTMQELVMLYAGLANDGIIQPLRFTNAKSQINSKRLLSPEASFLVLDMLKDTPVPNENSLGAKAQELPVAWKTGTSSRYRDAWTVGVFSHYVLAVWIGNFNNQGNQAFIGKEIAAPLFFEISNALNAQFGPLPNPPKYPQRMHLAKVDVCKASGLLPTKYCDEVIKEWFIPGKSPIQTDNIYREVAIDNKTGLRACHFDDNTRFEIYEFWSSDLLKIFKQAGIQRRLPPAYDPNCSLGSKSVEGIAPQITSPQTEVNYIAKLNGNETTPIPLAAVVDADVRTLYWFANNTYVGKTTREKVFLWQPLKTGNFTIRVVDDYGRSDVRNLSILTR